MLTVKNIATFSIVCILLISLCFSCNFSQKESLKKDQLQVDYYVRYLQADKQFKINISFTKIDSTGKRAPKKMEEVLFKGKTLNGEKIGNQYRYQLEDNTPFVDNYSLAYRPNQQEIDTTSIQIQSIHDFWIKKGKVSKTAGTNLIFEGTPLSNEEALIFLVSDVNNKTATIKVNKHPINSPIIILPEAINQLAVGKGTIYIVRKQQIERTLRGSQLTGLTEYYSKVKEIEIIE